MTPAIDQRGLLAPLREAIIADGFRARFVDYTMDPTSAPLFFLGDARLVMREIPSESVDCVMTSPPYWRQREYETCGIGMEPTASEYVENLFVVITEIKRVLKGTGSFWLNIGDSYASKSLAGIPWRIALKMLNEQDWILRNEVVWHKVKGGLDTAADKLRNVHEKLFHFVKMPKFYYNADAIRSKPKQAKIRNGAVVSATGVRGVRYHRQIEMSTALNEEEKCAAKSALSRMLQQIKDGEISDFRMIIRGQQRVTHSNSQRVSGRAGELAANGFYFLRYHPSGTKPSDVWDILPEDTQHRALHFSPYPEDLCKIPLLSTCPPGGVIIDPFCGTGTTMAVAQNLRRKSVGIDNGPSYLESAALRCGAFA